jgi:hypothetical protein
LTYILQIQEQVLRIRRFVLTPNAFSGEAQIGPSRTPAHPGALEDFVIRKRFIAVSLPVPPIFDEFLGIGSHTVLALAWI